MLFEFSLLPETREKASLVIQLFGLDDERAFQFCFSKLHVAPDRRYLLSREVARA